MSRNEPRPFLLLCLPPQALFQFQMSIVCDPWIGANSVQKLFGGAKIRREVDVADRVSIFVVQGVADSEVVFLWRD